MKPFLHALALACLPGLTAAQESSDVVHLRDGSTEVGKVVEEPLTGMLFQPESGPKKVLAWSVVQGIDYGDAPDDYPSAMATLGGGNFEVALEQFKSVLAATDLRAVIRQQALFQQAGIELRLGALSEASAHYTQLLKDFPHGRFVRPAGENLITLKLQQGDATGAQTVVADITRGLEGVAGVEPVLGLLDAGLLLASGKHAEARERYTALEGAGAELAEEARLGHARALLLEEKSAEAEPLLRELVTKSQNARVQSGAWNALGEIGAKDGRARKDAERILDSLYAYLRTVVQYKPLPGESTTEYERALAGAGTCFRYLSELESNADKKRLLRERQRERVDQLQREFPSSPFLEKG